MPHLRRPDSNDPRDIADFVDGRFDDLEQRLVAHMDAKFGEMRTLFLSGFPDGDPILHREYHKEEIELMKSRKALNRAVLEKLVVGGAWSALLAMAAALWMWIQSHMGAQK